MAEKRALRIMYGQHEATREQIQEPPLFHVVLLNDDYTTMEFVDLI